MKNLFKFPLRLTLNFLLALLIALPAQAADRITYYHNDVLGSPVAATSQTGQLLWRETYRPYGERLTKATASTNNHSWFTGKQEESALGINYFGARWYHPEVGRFLSGDPAGTTTGNIHSFNRYAYANNNPYKYVDPDGNSPAPSDLYYFSKDVGKLLVEEIVYVAAVVNNNQAVAGMAAEGTANALGDAALSTLGVINPVPGTSTAVKAARGAEGVAKNGLPKLPTGPGSVPKSERDPKRFFTPSERETKRAEQRNACANGCGTTIDEHNSAGHHIERHADGGRSTPENHAEVCIHCHKDIHAGG